MLVTYQIISKGFSSFPSFSSMDSGFVNSELFANLPSSIQDLCLRIASKAESKTSCLCPNSMALLMTSSLKSVSECSCGWCTNANQVHRFEGDFVEITDDMTDDQFEQLLQSERTTVIKNYDALPENAMKKYLRGLIQAARGDFITAAKSFLQAFSKGVGNGLIQCGKMLAKQANLSKITEEETAQKIEFDACIVFLFDMIFNDYAKLYLSKLLSPDSEFTIGSMKKDESLADSIIMKWVMTNEDKIMTRVQDIMDKQEEAVCAHVWRELPLDDLIPNPEDPGNPFTSFCEKCGKDKV